MPPPYVGVGVRSAGQGSLRSMRKTDGEVFAQVTRDPPLSDKVAKLIAEAIVTGRFQPGQRLDSERQLAETFGVSRTVIREAVRSLAAQGLVAQRSGRGVEVAAIDGDAVSRSMSIYLRGNPEIDYARIHEVRVALEVEIAGLAAQRATPEDIAQMQDINTRLGSLSSPEQSAPLDVEFHRMIAAATHNELFVVMLDSIVDVLLEVRLAAFAEPGMLEYAYGAHEAILDRLKHGDAEGARQAAQAHLDEAARVWRRLSKEQGAYDPA
jgi:GntR family transcriptional repressor for pyruvate dehydrogenase complex